MSPPAAEPIPIYREQDFYVPAFELRLDGRSPGQEVIHDIQQVTYKDSIEELDSFEITIANWDAGRRRLKYSDDELFDPGKKVRLSLGYRGNMRQVIAGEITSLQPTFPASGAPTLSVSGLNLLHRLRTKQRSQAYTDRRISGIAQEIGARLGIEVRSGSPTQEETHEHLFQDNRYDILFLWEWARRSGYEMFVGEDRSTGDSYLHFGPSQNLRSVVYELRYGRSLISFQPDLTTANQVGKVTVRGWDARNKRPIEASAERSELDTRGVGAAGRQSVIEQSFNQREEVIVDRPIQGPKEAKTLARETLERIAKDMVKGSGSTVGLPDLRAGSVVQLLGLGDRFSGRHFVTSTTHTLGDGGYTTQFECRREEKR